MSAGITYANQLLIGSKCYRNFLLRNNPFDRGEIKLSRNSVICSSQSQVNLYLHQHIHIFLLHEKGCAVSCAPFLVIGRTIHCLIAEAC